MITTIVYPYYGAAADGDELRLSMRSLHENLKGRFDVCVIGDAPGWYTGARIKATRITQRQYRELTGQRFNDRWHGVLDVLWKLCIASQCREISKKFVVIWDETMFFEPIDVEYLLTARHIGELPRTPPRQNDFWELQSRTRDRLLRASLSILDFSTHHPFPLEREFIPHYCSRWEAFVHPGVIDSQYHNWRRSQAEPINPSHYCYFNVQRCKDFAGALPTEKIVNFATVAAPVERALRSRFTLPSRWETS